MPIKIVETGSLDDKQFSSKRRPAKQFSSKRRPAKWKTKEPQPLPRKPIDSQRDRPKKPGITYPRKPKIITDPKKKKKYLEMMEKYRKKKLTPPRARIEQTRLQRVKDYKGGGMAQRGLGRAFMKGGKV